MALFEWDSEFSVGSEQMDKDHQKLFGIINHMHDQMKAGASEDDIKETIDNLINYTVYHFTEEEKKMERENYPGLPAQKRAHQAFADKMTEFQKEAEGGMAIFVVSEISQTALAWLKEHILIMDKQYEGQI